MKGSILTQMLDPLRYLSFQDLNGDVFYLKIDYAKQNPLSFVITYLYRMRKKKICRWYLNLTVFS